MTDLAICFDLFICHLTARHEMSNWNSNIDRDRNDYNYFENRKIFKEKKSFVSFILTVRMPRGINKRVSHWVRDREVLIIEGCSNSWGCFEVFIGGVSLDKMPRVGYAGQNAESSCCACFNLKLYRGLYLYKWKQNFFFFSASTRISISIHMNTNEAKPFLFPLPFIAMEV